MTDASAAGWRADPTGRFSHRWFDGNDWTDHVVGANGQPTTDAFPRQAVQPALPPPGGSTAAGGGWGAPSSPWEPAAAIEPAGSEWAPYAASSPPPANVTTAPPSVTGGAWRTQVAVPLSSPLPADAADDSRWVPSIVVALAGLVGVALSLFLLDWSSSGGSFLDGRKFAEFIQGSTLDDLLRWSVQYGSFAVFGLTAAAVVAVVLARPSQALRFVAALLAAIGAVVHTFTVVRWFRGVDPGIGAWVGTAGYLVVLIGLGLDAARRAR